MIVRRRTWAYRLAGQKYAHMAVFEQPVTAARARVLLCRKVGPLAELWARDSKDMAGTLK
ncbi:MAG: hypothetical protein JNJ60_08190 [Rhodocyclaceae bacterium]|nr:hypothetical protein [Rhodocyclaceae bacterium]